MGRLRGANLAYLRCPQCQNVVETPARGDPVCPRCGFTAPAPAASVPQPAPAFASPQAPFHVAPPQAWGRPRSFWTSFFLGIVTLGVYYLVWNFKSFRELDQEHGERHAAGWFWASLAVRIAGGLAISVAYGIYVGDNLADPQRPQPPSAATIGWFFAGLALSIAATAIFLAYAYQEISRIERYREVRGLKEGIAPVWFVLLFVIGNFAFLVPVIVAYYLLQKSINGVWWNVYAQRQIPWPL